VLRGQTDAVYPLVDCFIENMKGTRNRITPQYVEALEDALRDLHRTLRRHTYTDKHNVKYCGLVSTQLAEFDAAYFRLNSTARSLGRFGLE
jgi:hypothetical protein